MPLVIQARERSEYTIPGIEACSEYISRLREACIPAGIHYMSDARLFLHIDPSTISSERSTILDLSNKVQNIDFWVENHQIWIESNKVRHFEGGTFFGEARWVIPPALWPMSRWMFKDNAWKISNNNLVQNMDSDHKRLKADEIVAILTGKDK